MKLKIKKEIEQEIDISLPFYCEHGSDCFKIISETEYMQVSNPGLFRDIGVMFKTGDKMVAHLLTEARPLTEQEYNDRLEEAKAYINSLIIETNEPVHQ